ncbi:hypothetical protein HK101_011461 [Irineochytrium annulatum]|nr:hypothetical protein HK101_011461 [Irineochytrium annulatum]
MRDITSLWQSGVALQHGHLRAAADVVPAPDLAPHSPARSPAAEVVLGAVCVVTNEARFISTQLHRPDPFELRRPPPPATEVYPGGNRGMIVSKPWGPPPPAKDQSHTVQQPTPDVTYSSTTFDAAGLRRTVTGLSAFTFTSNSSSNDGLSDFVAMYQRTSPNSGPTSPLPDQRNGASDLSALPASLSALVNLTDPTFLMLASHGELQQDYSDDEWSDIGVLPWAESGKSAMGPKDGLVAGAAIGATSAQAADMRAGEIVPVAASGNAAIAAPVRQTPSPFSFVESDRYSDVTDAVAWFRLLDQRNQNATMPPPAVVVSPVAMAAQRPTATSPPQAPLPVGANAPAFYTPMMAPYGPIMPPSIRPGESPAVTAAQLTNWMTAVSLHRAASLALWQQAAANGGVIPASAAAQIPYVNAVVAAAAAGVAPPMMVTGVNPTLAGPPTTTGFVSLGSMDRNVYPTRAAVIPPRSTSRQRNSDHADNPPQPITYPTAPALVPRPRTDTPVHRPVLPPAFILGRPPPPPPTTSIPPVPLPTQPPPIPPLPPAVRPGPSVEAWVAEVATIPPSDFERVASFHADRFADRRGLFAGYVWSGDDGDGIEVSDSVSRVGAGSQPRDGDSVFAVAGIQGISPAIRPVRPKAAKEEEVVDEVEFVRTRTTRAGELVCAVESAVAARGGNHVAFVATDGLNAPICKVATLESNERDMVIFQNQFGGLYIKKGLVTYLNSRQMHGGRLTTQYVLAHDACDTEFRLTVIDDTNQKTALFHLKDATSTLAELRWCPETEFRCEVQIKGRKTLTIELLIAGAVMMRYGARPGARKLRLK